VNTKKCCHCKEDQPLDCFQKNSAARDGLQHRCKKCTREAHLETYAKRYHLWKERAKLWKKSNRDKVNKATRDRRNKDVQKARDENRIWRESNPYVVAMTAARKRAAQLGILSTLTAEEWRQVVEEANFLCHICGTSVCFEIGSLNRLSLDHVLPMSRGGKNVKENVAPAHNRCNKARSNMTMEEFDIWLNQVSVFRGKENGIAN
jgi:HNH endonuclease